MSGKLTLSYTDSAGVVRQVQTLEVDEPTSETAINAALKPALSALVRRLTSDGIIEAPAPAAKSNLGRTRAKR